MEKFKSIRSILFFLGFVVLLVSCTESTTPSSPPKINTPSLLSNPTIGESYSTTLKASDGKEPLTWSGNPPAGLKLNSKTGTISGQPDEAGIYRFEVTVTDSNTPTGSDSKRFLLTINSSPGEKLVVTTKSPLANAVVATPYEKSLEVSGASGRLTWASENLLKEFTLDHRRGIIAGIPSTAGILVFDVKVVDSANQCATKRFVLPVAGLLSVTSINPDNGARGQTRDVIITGSGFLDEAVSNFGDGIIVNSTNFDSSTQLTANITIGNAAALMPRTVKVTNQDSESGSLENAFEVLEGGARNIDIAGINNGRNWEAIVNEIRVDPVNFRVTIVVRNGDKITWRIGDNAGGQTHGVVFESESQMDKFLDIEAGGKPRTSQPDFFNRNGFGTEDFGRGEELLKATIKPVAGQDQELNFTCFIHGEGRMDGTLRFVSNNQ